MAMSSERKMRCRPDIGRRLVTSRFVALIFMICYLVINIQTTVAQQAYNNVSGYVCQSTGQTLPGAASCLTYTMFRSPSNKDTIRSISTLLNASASTVANLSELNLKTSNNLTAGDRLYVPLPCQCVNGIYQVMVNYIIQDGDIFEQVANSTFEGLTTWQAIEAANPTQDPNALAIGQQINVPLRCACPSSAQVSDGTKFLLSYMIFPEETLTAISNYFAVSIPDLIAANLLSGVTQVLNAFSTLLVPQSKLMPLSSFKVITPIPDLGLPPSPAVVNSPAASPGPPSIQTNYKRRSNTPLYIGVAIGVAGFLIAAILAALLAGTKSRHHRELEEHTGIENQRMLKPHHGVLNHMLSSRSEFLDGMSTVMDGDKPVIFTYEELRSATSDFSPDCRLQGSVFCGTLNGTDVAIKQMKGNMAHEIKILSQIHHMNVVSYSLLTMILSIGYGALMHYRFSYSALCTSCR